MTETRPATPLLDRIQLPADLKGLGNAELRQVADELLISEHTVKLHVSKVLRKLNLSNRTQMAVYGMQALR